MGKKIVFLSGTRADFGKLKSLINILNANPEFEVHIFATGMHMNTKYGYTVNEIEKCGYKNIFKYINHDSEAKMDITLGRTIYGFSSFVSIVQPDLIVVHGDRIEALAGASVGALNNILVAHIEGGELSGTVDELIRHAVTKLSHTHFVANKEAAKRILQMGEISKSVFVIGSPDMDMMVSKKLPSISVVKKHYGIDFKKFAISLFHPVTTELDNLHEHTHNYFSALQRSGLNYILIYPNNDVGSEIIMRCVREMQDHKNFKVFPSIRFESFLTLLKNSDFIIGNSSAGIRETPLYGVPTVNVGTRQHKRTSNPDIINTDYSSQQIFAAIEKATTQKLKPKSLFGTGNSDKKFLNILQSKSFWNISKQKLFAEKNISVK